MVKVPGGCNSFNLVEANSGPLSEYRVSGMP